MFRYRPLTLALIATVAATSAQAETTDPAALLIEQGHFWQAQEKPKRASEVWHKLLVIDPASPDALYGLGLIAVQEAKKSVAQGFLQQLQAIDPLPRQALMLEQDIHLLDPDNQALIDEARLLVEENEREKAAEVYRRALGNRPAQGMIGREVFNNLGFVEKAWPEARAGFERLQREFPADPYTKLFFAQHLARRLDTRNEGVRYLEKLAQRDDIGGAAEETWRLALTWMGPPDKSRQPLFESFLKTHPDDEEIRELLAEGRRRGQASNNKAAAAQVWRRDPVLDRALKALEKGDMQAAETDFTAYLKTKPKDPDALGGLGIVRQRQDRLEDAEVLLTTAVRNGGGRAWQSALNDVRYWSLLKSARQNIERSRLSDARAQLEQARKLKPNDVEAVLTLADMQAQQGQLKEAEANYRLAQRLGEQKTRALRGLAQVMGRQGKASEALGLLQELPASERGKVGNIAQLRAEEALQRARIAEQRGDTKGMRAALEAALKDDPDNAWARFALARLYVDMGAIGEARSLMDGLLAKNPKDRDALFTSALLSVHLEEWEPASKTLAKIPHDQRDEQINNLQTEVDFNLQLQRVEKLLKVGQRPEARAYLRRLESMMQGKSARIVAVARGYADAGDGHRATALMRDLLARSSGDDLSLMLSYGGVLLRAEQDVEVGGLLRDLQGRQMTTEQQKQYADLLFYYRVRQAEQLRLRGELAEAYDVLSPALAQRPQDRLALAALGRMYGAFGDTAKALEIFRPLAKRFPDDANIQVGAADMAAQQYETSYAEDALEQALKLAPEDRDILTTAARVYRFLGRTGTAEDLLRKVVAQEARDKKPEYVAAAQPATPMNPFAKPGHVSAPRENIPTPVQNRPVALRSTSTSSSAVPRPVVSQAIPAPITSSSPSAQPFSREAPVAASRYAAPVEQRTAYQADSSQSRAAVNPFAVPVGEDEPDPRAGMSEVAKALDDIIQQRSPYVAQGLQVRSNDSETGLSQMTDIQAPFEASMPIGDQRIALRVTPVSLNAGSVDGEARSRFGGGPIASKALPNGSPGSQKDSGVGLAVALDSAPHGLKADLGITPEGFLYSTAVGGVSVQRTFAGHPNMRWSLSASRRAVTDSVLSFAGTQDRRTGQKWGGVTANGGRAQISYDDRKVGAYGYASMHRLLGHNVEDNTRAEVGAGVYKYLQNDETTQTTVGLSLLGLKYRENLGQFTYGHGGYFSPQTFVSLGVPVAWSMRDKNWSVQLKGSAGMQVIQQDSADYFPGDAAMQAQASSILGYPAEYASDSSSGIGYSFSGAGEYRVDRNVFVGGHFGLDNAQDYRQWNGGLYLRYMLEDITAPMPLPVSPYKSPYSQ